MNSLRKKVLSLFLIFSLLVGIVGIINVDTTYAATKKIHLKKTTVSVVAGKTYQQKLIDKNGKTIKATKVKWKSLKTSVAKINKKGKITAVKAGTAKMTAKYNGKTYKFTVSIKKPFSSKDRPIITKIYLKTDEYGFTTIEVEWKKLKNAEHYALFCSENDGPYEYCSPWDGTKGRILVDTGDGKSNGSTFKIKISAVCGDYYSNYSAVKSITVSATELTLTPAKKIYDYVYKNGYSVNSDYIIPGNRCVESSRYYGTDYTDVYVVSIDTNDSSKIYFGSYRVKSNPGKYKDTTESTVLTYNINSSAGTVFFWQEYYTSDKYSSWAHYTSSGKISYADYLGASYYTNEKGITGITIGDNNTPVEVGTYDSKALIEGVNSMTIGVDKLIGQLLNIRLRDIGFTKL